MELLNNGPKNIKIGMSESELLELLELLRLHHPQSTIFEKLLDIYLDLCDILEVNPKENTAHICSHEMIYPCDGSKPVCKKCGAVAGQVTKKGSYHG